MLTLQKNQFKIMFKSARIIHLNETDSTNRYLQTLSGTEDIPSGSIVVADFQTQGRGQKGNLWVSEKGRNLTFSLLLKPEALLINNFFAISQITALSIKCILDKYTSDVTVKWPNDIYYKDRKICGILIENTFEGNYITKSIIGIGLNINQTAFESEAANAVSLSEIIGREMDIFFILNDFIKEFELQNQRLTNGLFDDIRKDYLTALYRKDGFYYFKDTKGSFEARICDIEQSGILVLERRDGTISKYAFKEVEYV
jgi:BirA family biotin operon repressor/biotin-[acetyl-CoA-carboxylase] ligase